MMFDPLNGLSLGVAAIGAALLTGSAGPDPSAAVRAALKERLPKTQVSAVDCGKVEGLCEVTAGDNLFYVDKAARYLVIGRVYDLQTRQDLTAARLLELNPDMLVGGAARAQAAADAGAGGPAPARRAAAAPSAQVDLSKLSRAGAIVWGRGGPAVTVFSDFACGYCRALAQTLAKMDVTVIERPISVLGSRRLADQVLCAREPAAAVHAAYAGAPIAARRSCDTRGLDENEAFARAHGFSGTPVIIRSDGAVIEGYRPAPTLAAWLKGAAS
jgi:thiol:disulfide interchange protein DsbC